MPTAYSEDLRKRVVDLYRSGVRAQDVSKKFAISVPCIYRWDKIARDTGALKPLYKAGDRSIIRDNEKFIAFAKMHAHSTLEQMASAWDDKVSISAVSRKLRKLDITRKKHASIPRTRRRKTPDISERALGGTDSNACLRR